MKFGPEASGVNLEEISLITDGQILVLALKKIFWPSNHYLDLFGIFPADVAREPWRSRCVSSFPAVSFSLPTRPKRIT